MSTRTTKPASPHKSFEQQACYHCDQRAITNSFCNTWRVWSCTACLAKHHRAHHSSCDVIIAKGSEDPVHNYVRYFSITFTKYDGSQIQVRYKLGDKLQMEDHWLGTYILSSSGLMLVRETRDVINQRILEGLASAR